MQTKHGKYPNTRYLTWGPSPVHPETRGVSQRALRRVSCSGKAELPDEWRDAMWQNVPLTHRRFEASYRYRCRDQLNPRLLELVAPPLSTSAAAAAADVAAAGAGAAAAAPPCGMALRPRVPVVTAPPATALPGHHRANLNATPLALPMNSPTNGDRARVSPSPGAAAAAVVPAAAASLATLVAAAAASAAADDAATAQALAPRQQAALP